MEEMREKEENRRLRYAAEEERIKADGNSDRPASACASFLWLQLR